MMPRLVAWLFVYIAGCCFWDGAALADKRVALVIGNSAYQSVPKLANPANDAGAIAELLRAAKFDVVESRRDLSITEMRRAFRDFSDKVRDADVAVVYYAGHGFEINGTNYLIPVDAVLQRDTDAYDEAITLDRALEVIEPARQLRLVILDACRDNPFVKSMKRTLASRALGRGLAGVEPGRANTLIAFAAKGGSTADDGNGSHSPFATALLQHLTTPGLDIRRALGQVRDDVMKATGDRQEPFVYGSLGGADVSLVPGQKAATSQAEADPQVPIRRDYELALQLGTRDGWSSFLRRYSDGFYADLARGQLNKLAAEEAQVAAAVKARQADAEKARLATEQATATAQAKAAAEARAAEQANQAAEKLKQEQQAKAEVAERTRVAAEKAATDAKATDEARKGEAAEAEQKPAQVAALPPPGIDTTKDMARGLQNELRRVGCLSGNVDGEWKASSQRSLEQFNKFTGMKLDVKLANLDAIDAVKSKTGRVCPLICDHGFRADGDACVKIACKAGEEVGDDNICQKIQIKKPVAKRPEPTQTKETSKTAKSARESEGQIFCSTGGCRPVLKGCHLVSQTPNGVGSSLYQVEKCD